MHQNRYKGKSRARSAVRGCTGGGGGARGRVGEVRWGCLPLCSESVHNTASLTAPRSACYHHQLSNCISQREWQPMVRVTPIYQTSTTIGSRRFRKPHDFRSEPFSDVRPITIFDDRLNKEQWEEGGGDTMDDEWAEPLIDTGWSQWVTLRRPNLEKKYLFLKRFENIIITFVIEYYNTREMSKIKKKNS